MSRKLWSTQSRQRLDIPAGSRYGMLTVIGEADRVRLPSGQVNRMLSCQCDCGTIKSIRLLHLTRLRITSCGCLVEHHGDKGSRLHNVWRAMVDRTTRATHINANRYIHRGIDLYPPWKKYLTFKAWALKNGYGESLYIDRRNNDKGYHPDNCRFVTSVVNGNNREVTVMVSYKGHRVSFMLLIRELGLLDHQAAIRGRISRGWSAERAIDTPLREGNYKRKNSNGILSA